jgi:hypothetical protein
MTTLKQRKINHVAFVVDESGSMEHLVNEVPKVFDAQVRWLAELSTDMDQETRVTLVTLSGTDVKVVLYDQDVLRLPSLVGNYRPANGTPLVQAVGKAIEDLQKTPELYGDHGFLLFALTDGDENTSVIPGQSWNWQYNPKQAKADYLSKLLGSLGDNWTVACLVPDFRGKMLAEQFGFAKGNIAIWDASSKQGLNDAGREIKQATGQYFEARAQGTRGTKQLFKTVVAKSVTQDQVNAANLTPVDPADFMIIPVALSSSSKLTIKIPKRSVTLKNPDGIKHVEIQPFVEETGRPYVAGRAYYRLTKSEKYYYGKGVALVHRTTRKVFRGPECEKLLEIDAQTTRIKPPAKTDEYEVYVCSTSFNRQIEVGGSILLFNK